MRYCFCLSTVGRHKQECFARHYQMVQVSSWCVLLNKQKKKNEKRSLQILLYGSMILKRFTKQNGQPHEENYWWRSSRTHLKQLGNKLKQKYSRWFRKLPLTNERKLHTINRITELRHATHRPWSCFVIRLPTTNGTHVHGWLYRPS